MLLKNSPQIGILRISSLEENDISLRLSISTALNSVEFSPRGISPSSILIVRELKDPMPGHFLPRSASADPEWGLKLRESITEIYHKASRSVSGIIPYNSPAVLFADESELIACLLMDMSLGMAGERWWWKVIIRNFPNIKIGGIKEIARMSAENLPAAIIQIYEWGQISSFFSAITVQDSEVIFSEVSREYGVPESEIRRVIVEMRKIGLYNEIQDNPAGKITGKEPETSGFSGSIEYLLQKIRESQFFSIRETEKISLFALCIILRLRPSIARTNVFIPVLLEFIAEIQKKNSLINNIKYAITNTITNTTSGEEKKNEIAGAWQVEADENGNAPIKSEDEKNRVIPSIPRHGHDDRIKHPIENRGKKAIISKFDFRSKNISDNIDEISGRSIKIEEVSSAKEKYRETPEYPPVKIPEEKIFTGLHETILSGTFQPSEDTEKALPVQEEVRSSDNGIRTHLCGVFYLINLMRELDLPACFEEEFGLSSHVGAWGTLELLGRAIIGNDERFRNDPLWDILAELDGRKKGTFPGNDIRDGGTYKMPLSWYEKCRQKTDAGFLFDEVSFEKIEGLLDLPPVLFRLMSCIMPFIRWYLRSKIDPDTRKETPEKDLLICDGNIYATSSHIDIIISLEDISIEARMSGLDRDPGWVANLGRVVKFHFE
ncbi:Uncharacterised protein [uncultured archaeon]|nr:Uncharacterised protein [uncultured archaeon]